MTARENISTKDLEANSVEMLRKKIESAVYKTRSYTPKVGVFGGSGVGKSSLCNALFGKDVAAISDVEACTRKPQEIFLSNESGKGGITLIDVPGIGEDPERQAEYTELYKSLIPELDLVLWAIKADDRKYDSDIKAYKAVFSKEIKTPVVFVITQADKTNDSEDWNKEEWQPSGTQLGNMAIKENDVSKRFDVATNKIISVSASKTGKAYNLKSLIDLVVEVLPNEKKYSVTREAKEENVSEEAAMAAEKGLLDHLKEVADTGWELVKEVAVTLIIESAPAVIKAAKEAVISFFKKFW